MTYDTEHDRRPGTEGSAYAPLKEGEANAPADTHPNLAKEEEEAARLGDFA